MCFFFSTLLGSVEPRFNVHLLRVTVILTLAVVVVAVVVVVVIGVLHKLG